MRPDGDRRHATHSCAIEHQPVPSTPRHDHVVRILVLCDDFFYTKLPLRATGPRKQLVERPNTVEVTC